MSIRRRLGVLAASLLSIALVAACRIYGARTRERIRGPEGLESPEITTAFSRVATMPQMRLLRRFVTRGALALCASGDAADLGCGPGWLVIELAQHAPDLRVTGIDLSSAMLAEAFRHAAEADVAYRVDFRTGDAAATPFADHSLDLVVSTLSLHHWSDPVAVFDEAARILKPGGAFVIFDLRRDLALPFYLLIWFATRFVVPHALRRIGEPLGSRNAAYTWKEAAALAQSSRLTGWRVVRGPLWVSIEGRTVG